MSKVARIEAELKRFSRAELRQSCNLSDGLIEESLKFAPELEASMVRSEREVRELKSA
ncbi:MAG: hypothetical protein M9920_06400 [Verrucomicrobiae bacterium]|nr:hypothetical protein [Verrucomicrobiae bacterium]